MAVFVIKLLGHGFDKLVMYIFFVLFFVNFSLLAQDNCGGLNVDLSSSFGPIREQCEGTCYAFQLTELLSHKLQREGKKISISPYSPAFIDNIDRIIKNTKKEKKLERMLGLNGGYSLRVLEQVIQNGFLQENELPINKCEDLEDLSFLKKKTVSSDCEHCSEAMAAQSFVSDFNKVSLQAMADSYKSLATNNKKYLEKISAQNIEVILEDKLKGDYESLEQSKKDEARNKIDSALKSNIPVGYNFYYNILFSSEKFFSSYYSHAATIIGKIGCDYILRDSHGAQGCEQARVHYKRISNDDMAYKEELNKIELFCGSVKEKGECSEKQGQKGFLECLNQCFIKNKKKLSRSIEANSFAEELIRVNKPPYQCKDGYFLIPEKMILDNASGIYYLK